MIKFVKLPQILFLSLVVLYQTSTISIFIIMPKLWLALFFGYNGAPFSGMQFQLQNHVATVQDLLVSKLHSAGFLATNNHSQLQKQQRWSRAARTDKGVHAVINAVSCHFIIDKIYFQEDHTLNRNRLHLDLKELFQGTQIVFHAFKRVTTRFEVRLAVRSRHYSYICPAFLFQSLTKKQKQNTQEPSKDNFPIQIKEKIEPQYLKQGVGRQQQIVENKQIGNKQENQQQNQLLQKINSCCKQYIGTHNFHNYSKNLRAKDAQAQRYIINFWVERLDEGHLVFHVVGQSFIYHQIRKMIGCIIMVFLNNYPSTYITNTFFRNQINMPLAPARGLYLNTLSFQFYNKKKDIPETLTFQELTSVLPLKQQINQYITGQEQTEWQDWVSKLRESIYHGIQYVEEDEAGEHIGKVVLQD